MLVVDDDELVRGSYARVARSWGADILEAGTVAAALALLAQLPDVVLLDVRLGQDESGVAVAEAAARMERAPAIIAISGQSSPSEAFRLARAGVREYLRKPVELAELARAAERALNAAPDVDPIVKQHVGVADALDVQQRVRAVMYDHALALTGQNLSRAAELLGIRRQSMQDYVRGRD